MMNKRKSLLMLLALALCGCSMPQSADHKQEKTEVIDEDKEEKAEVIDEDKEQEQEQAQDPTIQEPRQIRLAVPQKFQETSYYCAVACLQMMLAHHGIATSQDELAQALKTHPVTGTEYEDLAREASLYAFGKVPETDADPGYRAVLWNRNEGSAEDRALFESRALQDLEGNDPVFISVNNALVNDGYSESVHELLLYGVDLDDKGKPVMWYYIDPNRYVWDAEYGGKKCFSADQLWNAMNDDPEPGYVW